MLCLGMTAASLALAPRWVRASSSEPLSQRSIPSTGERLPVIGLGSSASFEESANRGDLHGLTGVLKLMIDQGGKVFDTAPSYGASEAAAGRIAKELGIAEKIFWATKTELSAYGSDEVASTRTQVQESVRKLGVKKLDLVQVHNLANLKTELTLLKHLKRQVLIRYLGVRTPFRGQNADLRSAL